MLLKISDWCNLLGKVEAASMVKVVLAWEIVVLFFLP